MYLNFLVTVLFLLDMTRPCYFLVKRKVESERVAVLPAMRCVPVAARVRHVVQEI